MDRYYLSPLIGVGTDDDPRRPLLADADCEACAMTETHGALALVHVRATEAQHKKIAALDGVVDIEADPATETSDFNFDDARLGS